MAVFRAFRSGKLVFRKFILFDYFRLFEGCFPCISSGKLVSLQDLVTMGLVCISSGIFGQVEGFLDAISYVRLNGRAPTKMPLPLKFYDLMMNLN